MVGKVLDLNAILKEDQLGCAIANRWVEWNNGRQNKIAEWKELQRYIYATSTKDTSSGKLPWSNTTTMPKLTQIRDNLYSNYLASMFPKRKWLNWLGDTKKDEGKRKTEAIKDYMMWAVSQPQFKTELGKMVLDYIDYGNVIPTVEWVDESIETKTGFRSGFVGPRPVRISPIDIVFNPTAPNFQNTPKIIRSLVTIGEAKEMLERVSSTETDKELANAVFDYAMGVRGELGNKYGATDINFQNDQYAIDGFTNFQYYMKSDYMELLTFVGDIYEHQSKTFLKNHLIIVIDRHKIAVKKPYPYPIAGAPIFHAGWRIRQDNLWAMGPLDNLVGLQYRLDHVENMKADIMDLTTYPVLKIKGSGAVGDFDWGPLERIYVDADGDVDMVTPDVQALQCNIEIQAIEAKMEEMAGSPKEAMGFRTPGEKTAYEVQRLENAAARIFQNKIAQFEEQVLEPLLNAMLILAKENLSETSIRTIDDEYGIIDFKTISRNDLAANGRLKPMAARHFAEQAEMIQNLTQFYSSSIGQDEMVQLHMSSVKTAEMVEDLLNIQDYDIVTPYIRIAEQTEAERMKSVAQEQIANETMTPAGLTPDDYTEGSISNNAAAFQNPTSQEVPPQSGVGQTGGQAGP